MSLGTPLPRPESRPQTIPMLLTSQTRLHTHRYSIQVNFSGKFKHLILLFHVKIIIPNIIGIHKSTI